MKPSRRRGTLVVAIAGCLAPVTFELLSAVQAPTGAERPEHAAASILLLLVDAAPDGVPRVRQGLTHRSPLVRSTAARVAALTNRADLIPTVAEAFARESDEHALSEQTHALLVLSNKGESMVAARLLTNPHGVGPAYLTWLALNRPDQFLDTLPQLGRYNIPNLQGVVNMVARRHPALVLEKIDTWAAQIDPKSWKELSSGLGVESLAHELARRRKPARPSHEMRAATVLAPGVLPALLEITGCEPRDGQAGLGRVTFDAMGRLTQFGIDERTVPETCAKALRVIVRTTKADLDSPIGEEWVVLPIDRDYVECVSDPAAFGVSPPRSVGPTTGITPPTKTKDVRPIYPKQLIERRVQGRVIVLATVSKTGCVTHVRVTSSADPAFDYAAVKAVMGWRFTPTLVDGQRFPVLISITVTFSLQ